VCSGFSQGFACLCRILRERGVGRIAVEDPGWERHRLIARASGLRDVSIAVDDQGLDVAALAGSGCEVVVVTPAHHFPTGAVLSRERRAGLLEWAEEEDGLIVEDDYDSELRYDRVAVGALQGLAPERVCQIGSLSKRLAPRLGLGWILSPSWLSGALTFEQGVTGGGAPVPDQLALAAFLAAGELDRHLRRVRLRYRDRRAALVDGLAECLPAAQPVGAAAGLFTLVRLAEDVDVEAVVRSAGRRGLDVTGLGQVAMSPHGPRGLILGFAASPEPVLRRAVRLLAQSMEEAE